VKCFFFFGRSASGLFASTQKLLKKVDGVVQKFDKYHQERQTLEIIQIKPGIKLWAWLFMQILHEIATVDLNFIKAGLQENTCWIGSGLFVVTDPTGERN
jgi:hypothetical protein